MPPFIEILAISFDLLQIVNLGAALFIEIVVIPLDMLQNMMLMCGGPPAHLGVCFVVVAVVTHDDIWHNAANMVIIHTW